ncbi:MAG: hypothetical protein OHK0039_14270 [Bacteroidia bacterium]
MQVAVPDPGRFGRGCMGIELHLLTGSVSSFVGQEHQLGAVDHRRYLDAVAAKRQQQDEADEKIAHHRQIGSK